MDEFAVNLEGLNDRQVEAVLEMDGRIRVVAGAGSGKTRVLATRFAYLVEEVGLDPANILCMTFTNKAAQEMKSRIASMVRNRSHINDFVCTIHGFCVKVLRRDIYRLGFPENFIILDEEDGKGYAKQVMDELNIDRKQTTANKFLEAISGRKCHLAEDYVARMLPKALSGDDAFSRYLALQIKYFALDYDDLIFFTLYLFDNFPEVKEYWQNVLEFVMVDEVQDCSGCDWAIINSVTEQNQNLFIVGDPDQAIYEWRGASPDSFVNFEADKTIILNENYRSTPNILNVANSVIANNQNRIPKDLFTAKPAAKVAIHFHGKSENEEAQWVSDQIETLVKAGADYNDFAILYRASQLSRAFEQSLIKKEVPYTVWGGVRFFERREIKDALAYLRMIASDDDMSFRRIINVPSRKFGEESMKRLAAIAEEEHKSLFATLSGHLSEKPFSKSTVFEFSLLIEKYRLMRDSIPISDILDGILKDSGLKDQLRGDGDEDRLANIQELLNSVKLYEEQHAEDDITLDSYLQDIALYTNADYKKDDHKVKLMTIHQSKGLEFPYVFVVGLTEGVFPSHRSIRERRKKGEEEERRLMYVAVTRAEKAVFLTESEGFNMSTQANKYPSRFLNEIKSDLIEVEGEIDPSLIQGTMALVSSLNEELENGEKADMFEPGAMVTHKLFGTGVVVENNKDRASCRVDFGNRKLTLRYAVLTPAEQ
jgi:DNA helicase-2/ATP-dependent DNA helicase PcrA